MQETGSINGHLLNLDIEFDFLDSQENELASVRIGSDHKFANIYPKDIAGKIGEIKVDSETLTQGDYQVSCKKGIVNERMLKLFSAITVHGSLITPEVR